MTPAAGGDEGAADRPTLFRIAWAFYLLLALAGIVWIGWRGDLGLGAFISPERWLSDLGVGIGAGLALIGFWRLARAVLPAARELEARMAELVGSVGADEIFALAVMSGVAEEIFFRGAVQGSWGWLWATALFAVLHTGPGREYRLWTLFAAVAGLVFAAVTLWSGSLMAAIVAHALVNGVNLRAIALRPVGDG